MKQTGASHRGFAPVFLGAVECCPGLVQPVAEPIAAASSIQPEAIT